MFIQESEVQIALLEKFLLSIGWNDASGRGHWYNSNSGICEDGKCHNIGDLLDYYLPEY